MRQGYKRRYERVGLKENALVAFLQKHPIAISDITDDIESTWDNWHTGLNSAARDELLTIDGHELDRFLTSIHKGVIIEVLKPGIPLENYGAAKQFVFYVHPYSKEPMIAFILDRKLLPFLALN